MAVNATVKQARERYKLAETDSEPQRQRENDDLRFYALDQWPDAIRKSRDGQPGSGTTPAIPARPTLVIDKTREPIKGVLNQQRAADLTVEIVAADDFGDLGVTPDDTEITLREGLVRRIVRDPETDDALTWGFSRATIAGQGYCVVMTRYLPGKSWDQEVYVHRIYNQSTVRIDPSHTMPDGSDANWGFPGGTWKPWDVYKATHPSTKTRRNVVTDAGDSQFGEWAKLEPTWASLDTDDKGNTRRAVYVVDYFYTELESRELALLPDGSGVWADELPPGVEVLETRTVVERKVKWCKLDGFNDEPLDETDWPSPDIPIVKFLGEELHPYDNEKRVEGMIRPVRDSQIGINAMASKQVEVVAYSPIPALQVDPAAIQTYEQWYALANTRPLPYLPYRTYDDLGRQLSPPTRLQADPNIVAIANSLQMFNDGVIAGTGGAAPNRMRVGQSVQAASAIDKLQQESEFNTSDKLDNFARSMRRVGAVINGLLYPIYGTRQGRMVRIMTGEGESETMQVTDPQQAQQQQAMRQQAMKVGKLTKDAHFNVHIKVGKNYQTRRLQQTAVLGALIGANPEFMGWFGDLFLKGQDVPMAKQMAERAEVMLLPPIQKMLAAKDEAPIPPKAQAEIAQLQQRVQDAEGAMQELAEEAKGKKIDQQTKITIAQLEDQRDRALAELNARVEMEKADRDNATKIHIAEINAKSKGVIQAAEAEHEMIALGHTQSHEAEQQQLDRDGQQRIAAHDAALADGQADRGEAEAERGRQATADENERNREAATQEGE